MSNEDSSLWDPSNWDWLNNKESKGEESIDGTIMDCPHPWSSINFLESVDLPSETAIGCSICGEVWEENNIELLATIWQATKEQLYLAEKRIEGLEKVIAENLDVALCATCGVWNKKNTSYFHGSFYSCYQHIASSIPDPKINPTPLFKAVEYIKELNLFKSVELSKRAQYERMVTDCVFIADALEDEDFDYSTYPIDLSDCPVVLGMNPVTTLDLIVSTIARKCDLSIPNSRIGKSYILNLLHIASKIKNRINTGLTIEEEIKVALPSFESYRVSIAVQLCFPDVGEDTQFSGEMAEEALFIASKRVISNLIK